MCPPSEDCASKKVTGSVPLDCSLGPEAPKILFINPVFLSKNRFFADFAMKTFILFFCLHPKIRGISRIFYDEDLFLWSSLLNSREKSFCAPKKLHMPPQSRYSGAGPATAHLICMKKTNQSIRWSGLDRYSIKNNLLAWPK